MGLPPEQFKVSPLTFSTKIDKRGSTKFILRRKRPRPGSSYPSNDHRGSAHVDEIKDTGCSNDGQEKRGRLDASSPDHQNEAAEKDVNSNSELVTSTTGGESRDSPELSAAAKQPPNSAGGDDADDSGDDGGGTGSAHIIGSEEEKSEDSGEGSGERAVGCVDHLCEFPDYDVNITANYEGKVMRAVGKRKKWEVNIDGGVVEGDGQVYVLGECSCVLSPL